VVEGPLKMNEKPTNVLAGIPSLVHFSYKPEHLLWDELGTFSVTKLHQKVLRVRCEVDKRRGPACWTSTSTPVRRRLAR